MKGLVLGMGLSLAVVGQVMAANDLSSGIFREQIRAQEVAQQVLNYMAAGDVINWKKGDFHNISIEMIFGGGKGHKEAGDDEVYKGVTGVWYNNTMEILGQKQEQKALISRKDGKTLRMIVNGKEEDPNGGGDGKIDIIEQKETQVTVKAGTFDCMYVKAKITAQGQESEVEIWINPVDINLDGMLKIVMQSQFGPITMSLEDFGPKHKL